MRGLGFREATAFFLPLAFNAELMMVSHTIIHAALARLEGPTVSLAAYSTAFSVHTILSAPTVVAPFTGLAFIRDRGSVLGVLRFHGTVLVLPAFVMLLLGATTLGDAVFGDLIGTGPAVTAQARQASLIFAWVHPLVALRNTMAALLMLNRRTILITLGTALRVAALVGFLLALTPVVDGAPAGVLSLFLCIAVEVAFVAWVSRRYLRALPARAERPTGFPEMWGFAWPLMVSQITEGSLAFVINVFIGRLPEPDLAFAAFGVVRGLAMLLLIPLRNLAQTAQTLVHTQAELRTMMRFALLAVLFGTGVIAVLFWSPLRPLILEGVMGLPADVRDYATPAVQAMVAVPVVWGYAALFRGLLSGLRRTKAIGASGLLKLGAVVLTGTVALLLPRVNGAVMGITAIGAAFGAEFLLLGWRLFLRGGVGHTPFAERRPPAASAGPAEEGRPAE